MKMTSTNYNYVIDSHAWIEYFKGTQLGEVVNEILEGKVCFTPTIVIAELSDKYSRSGTDLTEKGLQFIIQKSNLIELRWETALEAGKLKQEIRKNARNNFGLADAIVLATAKKLEALVVTGDHHFKGLEGVEYLE